MKTSGSRIALAALVTCAAFLAACQDTPTSPAVGPQFLIGGSPLSPITLDKTGTPPVLRASVTVNKGSTSVPIPGKWVVRGSGQLQLPDGRTIASLGPKGIGLTARQEAQVRDGSDVGVIMDMDIPAPTWERIKDLDDVHVQLLVELIFIADSGDEKVLDSVRVAGTVSSKGGD